MNTSVTSNDQPRNIWKERSSRAGRAAGAVLVWLLAGHACGQGVAIRNLALSGQQAPGLPAGLTFSAFDAFSINASGQIGLFATIAGPGVTATNNQGIWWTQPGSLQLVMRLGDPAPGQSGFTYASTTVPNLSDSGLMAYAASIRPSGGGSIESLWTISPTSPAAAFALGFTQAPGLEAGTQWNAFNAPQINQSGVMAFRAILSGTNAGNSHWIGTPSALSLVGRDGFPTGVLAGVNFSGLFNEYRINSSGTYAFRSSLTGTGVTTSNNQALWSRSPAGVLTLVARTGDQAPQLPSGVTISSITGDPELDRSGRLAYRASLAGPGIDSTNNNAIFIFDNGTTTVLARRGDPAPGLPADVLLDGSFQLTFGGGGSIALRAQLRGAGVNSSNNSAIWKRVGNGPFTLLAREGSAAPGVVPTANFGDVRSETRIAMNASGKLMLAAALTNSREGIWLEDASGALRLAVLEQTQFDVNDDPNITTLKTASALGFPPEAGDDDGRFTSFSDTGEVVFRLAFTDATSGAFIARLPQACDSIDFNNDASLFDPTDIDAFLSVFSEGPCVPETATCNDVDFNNDGSLFDPCDIDSFLLVFSEGPCTLCGQ